MKIDITVNGKKQEWDIAPDEFLADALRRNGYTSVKIGCNDGACGVCTVILDDKPILSCEYLAARANGKTVLTAEGLGDEGDKIVDALVIRGGEGCGYCAPGYTVLAYAAKKDLPKDASYDEVKAYLDGNLCRCTGYTVRIEALMDYLKMD